MTEYRPISCDFHDRLEALATTREVAQIRFLDADGARQDRNAMITDVYSLDGVEYMSLNTGDTVRLDRIVEIQGAMLPR